MTAGASGLTAVLVLLGAARPAAARVKLAALPERERVEIQLDHGAHTLVEEERRFGAVPVRKTFTFDGYRHGALNPDKPLASRILTHYVLTNDEDHGLGAFPLQPGKVRVFIQDSQGGEAFLGEDMTGLTRLDDDMRIFLGESRDIVCTRTIERNTVEVKLAVGARDRFDYEGALTLRNGVSSKQQRVAILEPRREGASQGGCGAT
ncbi:MAG: hypothetical protein ACYS22_15415 [Planctomycetota bacterium]|jgi:hypothetical protein